MTVARRWTGWVLVGLAACRNPAAGTFVGNPNLTARYFDSDTQQARGGQLVASSIVATSCVGEDVLLGGGQFTFERGGSTDTVQLPPDTYCSVVVQAEELTVQFQDDSQVDTTVSAFSFELLIEGEFTAGETERFELRLADESWLSDLAAVTVPGENVVDDGALEDAFFVGLVERSGVGPAAPTVEEDLSGRLNLEDYPVSPLGTPTRFGPCGPSAVFALAVPVAPAAMAARGLGPDVGWCEGTVTFDADLTERSAVQVDYSDGSTYLAQYNGWGQGCASLHCNSLYSSTGDDLGLPCTVLARCEDGLDAVVTGYGW